VNEDDKISRLLRELRSEGADVAMAAEALLKTAEDRGQETLFESEAVRGLEDALAVYRLKAAEGAAMIERAEAKMEVRCG
jgi:fructose-specific phosphotransferase system component IIB